MIHLGLAINLHNCSKLAQQQYTCHAQPHASTPLQGHEMREVTSRLSRSRTKSRELSLMATTAE